MKFDNHYKYLYAVWMPFIKAMGVNNTWVNDGMISAHGDKAYCYQGTWEREGIHFYRGVLLYLLGRVSPYDKETRQTDKGFVAPDKWVLDNYKRFLDTIEKVEKELGVEL